MTRLGSIRSISAIAAAALVGTAAAFLAPVTPDARADTQFGAAALQRVSVKGDRLPPRATATPCSSQAWPNHEAGCQFDFRRPAGELRKVRVVSLNRSKPPIAE
jgi:hypothetical protein